MQQVLEAVMAERRPIFSTKDHCAQIGYVEADEAFDLSGRLRCTYNAASGNLLDTNTGKIVGHVSLAGNFVGSRWMADELFGTSGNPTIVPNVPNITEIPDPGAPEQETEPVVMAETSGNPDPPNVPNITEIPDPGAPEQETEPVVMAETSENPDPPNVPNITEIPDPGAPEQETGPVVMAETTENPEDPPNVPNITEIPDPGAPEQETGPVVMAETTENPEALLDRAIKMVQSALKEKPPPRQE